MMTRPYISISIRRLAISLLLLVSASASAQTKFFSIQKDSIPFFRGFAVSFDLVGAGMMALSDNGQFEGALRINLHDEWFPIVEAGLGKASHDDEVTKLHYKTSAPYFKIGIDKNMLKDKHGPNRLYVGLRYGFTSYKVDISRPEFIDPVWKWNAEIITLWMRPANITGQRSLSASMPRSSDPCIWAGVCAISSVCPIQRRALYTRHGMCQALAIMIPSWAAHLT